MTFKKPVLGVAYQLRCFTCWSWWYSSLQDYANVKSTETTTCHVPNAGHEGTYFHYHILYLMQPLCSLKKNNENKVTSKLSNLDQIIRNNVQISFQKNASLTLVDLFII